MVTISIRFLTGRAHLHHWQAHHSDGKVDWPPSPWRLLRALVAVAGRGLTSLPAPDFFAPPGKKAKPSTENPAPSWPAPAYKGLPDDWHDLGGASDIVPISRLANLLGALSAPPEIWLPRTSGGHTRQYFPIHEGGRVKNSGSAVFDTFAVVAKDQPILFHWRDLEWGPTDQRLHDLGLLLSRLGYFGRAESWCLATASPLSPMDLPDVRLGATPTHWCCPCLDSGAQPGGREYIDYNLERKLAPLPLALLGGADGEVKTFLPRTKKIAADRPSAQDCAALLDLEAPETLLLRCLLRESGQDMTDGLERPIGSRWVHYAVPRAIYVRPPEPRKSTVRRPESVQVVRYALNTASVHRPVLPPVTDTLLVADKFRSALLALHRAPSRNFSGHDADGAATREAHAYFWPTDENDDGYIDHVTVYCPSGFDRTEIEALRRLCRVRQRGGRPDLLITPTYVGHTEGFQPWSHLSAVASDQRSRIFVSATPYYCPVHLNRGRGRGRPRSVVTEILKGMRIEGVIVGETPDPFIREMVFDYAPAELAALRAELAAGRVREPVPPRQTFLAANPPETFPPLPDAAEIDDPRYRGAAVKAPDAPFSLGASIGMRVADGSRFVRALDFVRRRRNHEARGFGRMFLIEFAEPRIPRPFAIGDQRHFGLGLFVPLKACALDVPPLTRSLIGVAAGAALTEEDYREHLARKHG